MADKLLKSITFPDLTDKYIVGDTSLSVAGAGADSKTVGDKFAGAEADLENIINASTVQTLSNNTPYLFRQTPKAGHSEFDTLVGGSVAWNQLATYGTGTTTNNGITFTKNGSIEANGTATGDGASVYSTAFSVISGHKYYLAGGVSNNVFATLTTSGAWGGNNPRDYGTGKIASCTNSASSGVAVLITTGTQLTNAKIFPMCIDLTQLFGSTVADAIYAMEQSTAGSGVAYFRSLFGASYYPYNAGELLSVSGVSAHNMTGFNQWDEEWELGQLNIYNGQNDTASDRIRSKNYIPCVPNTSYSITFPARAYKDTGNIRVCFYDKDKNFIESPNWYLRMFTTPANACYLRFFTNGSYGTVYQNDICINIAWDGSRNGTYEPYEIHSYPLDNSLTLRGIPKWNNGLYYDGDVYEADGTVSRKYGIVDLGTLTWTYESAPNQRFQTTLTGGKEGTNTVCTIYDSATFEQVCYHSKDKIIGMGGSGVLAVYDSAYSSASAFKTAMNGVYLVYELATPTTETADPYQKAQICDPSGTEEYVSTSIVPVGHETDYPMTISDIAPSTNGTYTLKCTVSGGVKTYEWASA